MKFTKKNRLAKKTVIIMKVSDFLPFFPRRKICEIQVNFICFYNAGV